MVKIVRLQWNLVKKTCKLCIMRYNSRRIRHRQIRQLKRSQVESNFNLSNKHFRSTKISKMAHRSEMTSSSITLNCLINSISNTIKRLTRKLMIIFSRSISQIAIPSVVHELKLNQTLHGSCSSPWNTGSRETL